jgi:hypothetical protein
MPDLTMAEPSAWYDEIETLDALSEAARAAGGMVIAQPGAGIWQLWLPGILEQMGVRLSGEADFPLVISTGRWKNLVVPAAFQPVQMEQFLASWCLQSHPQASLRENCDKLSGWALAAEEVDQIGLARVDQTSRGWPTLAQLRLEENVVIARAALELRLIARSSGQAIDCYLKKLASLLVTVYKSVSDSKEQDSRQILYQLAMPAAFLSNTSLASALAMLGRTYHAHTLALEGLAADPLLARTFMLCEEHRLSQTGGNHGSTPEYLCP